MRRFVCGESKRPAGLAMEGLRRPTKSRQGAMPNSAKPTQVGSLTRRFSCVARQRLPIPSILSRSTPHPQPPHLYKCGGSHAANNEEPRSGLHFAAIEPCSAKTSAARPRQPFIPASSAIAISFPSEEIAKPGRDARPARPQSRGTHDPTKCAGGFAITSSVRISNVPGDVYTTFIVLQDFSA